MQVFDGEYAWEGFGGMLKLASGKCRLVIFDLARGGAPGLSHLRSTIVLVSDLPESRMSVRSCAGHIATCVARDFRIDHQRMLYIEHYPESAYGEHREHLIPEKFDAVDFNWTEGGAIQPKWRTLKPPLRDVIQQLLQERGAKENG
jgi:hypothetical protein